MTTAWTKQHKNPRSNNSDDNDHIFFLLGAKITLQYELMMCIISQNIDRNECAEVGLKGHG